LAFAAGLVAALNPCGFAMLPGYLALVVRGDERRGLAALGRAATATVAMTAGFVAVFAVFGVLTVSLTSTVYRYLPYVTAAIGIALVAVGIWLLAGRRMALPVAQTARWAPSARLGSMFGYGVSYAIASLSCTVAPFLAVTGVALHGGWRQQVAVYLAYAGGMALVVGALAVAAAFASAAVAQRVRRIVPAVNRLAGALLVVVGLYVGYYGIYEVRLFHFNGNPQDPVISAAGHLQGAIAGWVREHGAWPWFLLLVVATIVAVGWAVFRRRVRRQRTQI
jgi:cytochrome c biogenesis protein CcdA